jgi:carbamoyl-phosphate synthase large subunit
MQEIANAENEITQSKDIRSIEKESWLKWKRLGFSDDQIAALTSQRPSEVRKNRTSKGVRPYVNKIDTTSAEYPSPSNYLYMSYFATSHDDLPRLGNPDKTAVILGGGAYRVGSSVEFDWCAVATSVHLQAQGWKRIMINCNPETVSTDYNLSDRLYFEELSVERILDIVEFEDAGGVIVSVGGQRPNQLAQPLSDAGLKLLGHGIDAISSAENRNRFSQILDEIQVKQPPWISAQSKTDIHRFTETQKFPLIIRPSYVLSGAAMNVAWNSDSLELFLKQAQNVSREHPVVVSKFIEGAKEIEVDGVAKNGEIIAAALSEHIEHAGVHSGDATLVFPTQHLASITKQKIKEISLQIVQKLSLNGPFNIQYMVDNGTILVIECNARSSRSFPFVSKVSGRNLSELAALTLINKIEKPKETQDPWLEQTPKNRIGVKAAMFSFNRLDGVDPISGVEMLSTGEVGCMAPSFEESLLLALEASGIRPPRKGVLISAGPKGEKSKILPALSYFKESKIQMFATSGTAAFLKSHGYESLVLAWPGESKNDVIHSIRNGSVDFVINIPKSLEQEELQHSALIRKSAIRYGRTLMTDLEKAAAYFGALKKYPQLSKTHRTLSL